MAIDLAVFQHQRSADHVHTVDFLHGFENAGGRLATPGVETNRSPQLAA